MTVYRSPRGKWMIDVVLERPNGETLRVRKVAPVQTRRDAEAYERDLRRAVLEGTHDRVAVPTLATFAPRWLDHQRAINRPSEIKAKEKILRLYLLPALATTRLDAITTATVDQLQARILAAGLAPATVANVVAALRRLLRQACDWGVIDRVPTIRPVRRPPCDRSTAW